METWARRLLSGIAVMESLGQTYKLSVSPPVRLSIHPFRRLGGLCVMLCTPPVGDALRLPSSRLEGGSHVPSFVFGNVCVRWKDGFELRKF